jgi:nucleoside-triphosphatase
MQLKIVTAPKNGKKTTFLYAMCSRLDSKDLNIGGIIQVVPLPNKEKVDWTLSDQSSGETQLLMSLDKFDNSTQYGRFFINEDAFKWANDSLLKDFKEKDVITVDEVGPLELENRGLNSALETLLKEFDGILILVIRDTLLEEVAQHFNFDLKSAEIYHSDQSWEEQLKDL